MLFLLLSLFCSDLVENEPDSIETVGALKQHLATTGGAFDVNLKDFAGRRAAFSRICGSIA